MAEDGVLREICLRISGINNRTMVLCDTNKCLHPDEETKALADLRAAGVDAFSVPCAPSHTMLSLLTD